MSECTCHTDEHSRVIVVDPFCKKGGHKHNAVTTNCPKEEK